MPSAGDREEEIANLRAKAIGHILEHDSLGIQDFERPCPDVNRRSLQRDLKAMVDMGLLVSEGATNKLVYRMKEAG
jgi:cell filamentation protein, protein adenylyltransferase